MTETLPARDPRADLPVPDDADPADLAPLVCCDSCGRYGWRGAHRCPSLSVPGATVDFPDRKVQPMPTNAIAAPDIPLPSGALADDEGWEFWDNQFRIFHGPDRTVSDAAGEKIGQVLTGGIQLPDGSVDITECPPSIDVYVFTDDGITAQQARGLAAALLEAAAELDRWTER